MEREKNTGVIPVQGRGGKRKSGVKNFNSVRAFCRAHVAGRTKRKGPSYFTASPELIWPSHFHKSDGRGVSERGN